MKKLTRAVNRYLALPPNYSVRAGEFTVEYSKGSYAQVTPGQKHFLFDTPLAAVGSAVSFSRCSDYTAVG